MNETNPILSNKYLTLGGHIAFKRFPKAFYGSTVECWLVAFLGLIHFEKATK